jgi:hypothetical protein
MRLAPGPAVEREEGPRPERRRLKPRPYLPIEGYGPWAGCLREGVAAVQWAAQLLVWRTGLDQIASVCSSESRRRLGDWQASSQRWSTGPKGPWQATLVWAELRSCRSHSVAEAQRIRALDDMTGLHFSRSPERTDRGWSSSREREFRPNRRFHARRGRRSSRSDRPMNDMGEITRPMRTSPDCFSSGAAWTRRPRPTMPIARSVRARSDSTRGSERKPRPHDRSPWVSNPSALR